MNNTTPQWETEVRQWHESASEAHAYFQKLGRLLNVEPESQLYQHLWALIGGWAGGIAQRYNLGQSLDYWMHDCQFGANHGWVELSNGSAHELTDIDALIAMLAEDLAQSEKEVAP